MKSDIYKPPVKKNNPRPVKIKYMGDLGNLPKNISIGGKKLKILKGKKKKIY